MQTIKPKFGQFLLAESKNYLGQKIGDILSALQSLHDDASHLGSAKLVKASHGIVNQIRIVIHDDWPDTEIDTLQSLQRVGVALAKAIEDDGDLPETLAAAVQELQQLSGDMGEPINDFGSSEDQ